VLAPRGRLLAAFMNPSYFLFDHDAIEAGEPAVLCRRLPHSDAEDLPAAILQKRLRGGHALQFSHSLEAQIGGQVEAGFTIAGLYEDDWNERGTPLNAYMPTSIATLAKRS
jgi:hypothetical protein